MKKTNINLKELLIVLLILVVAKFGINYIYEHQWVSIDKIKYSLYTQSMEQINSERLNQIIESGEDVYLVYMGRESCPSCIDLLPRIKNIFAIYETAKINGQNIDVKQYYYDSEINNDKQKQKLKDQFAITTVPVILIIKSGDVILFEGDDLALNDYLSVFEDKSHWKKGEKR